MANVLFTNLTLLDPVKGRLLSGYQVLVEGNRIAKVEKGRIRAKAKTIDCGGRTLMPGLIDCHNHISVQGLARPQTMLPSLDTAHALSTLGTMLQRGFTTLRDCAGADLGHKQAIEKGLFPGPRLFVSGRRISQTGGHSDPRVHADMRALCECLPPGGGTGRVADGVDGIRRAIRDEVRLGADQIKIMAGGSVASAAEPIGQLQYSMEELRAAADEATRLNIYVAAHAYTDEQIRRCVEAGMRTIEHGNLLSESTAKMMAARGAYLVPTLVTFHLVEKYGPSIGFTDEQMGKCRYVRAAGARSLDIAKRAGVKMAYGTDITYWQQHQGEEFLVRAEVLPSADLIRSATVVGAEVVGLAGKLGVIAPGAFADLLVIDGDPFADLGLFQDQGRHMSLIMANGRIAKNTLRN